MKTALVYVFPTAEPPKYINAACKFLNSYLENPGSADTPELHVIVNGDCSMCVNTLKQIFNSVPVNFHYRDNWGKDLGAFLYAAQYIECDLLVCMGSHVNFWKPGWLDVITRSYANIGPAVYGAWGFQEPEPHLRTTFFWCPPSLLTAYPWLKTEADRYGMEHGPENIALWGRKQGFEPYQITWDGAFSMKHWHALRIDEGLALDQHTERHFGK